MSQVSVTTYRRAQFCRERHDWSLYERLSLFFFFWIRHAGDCERPLLHPVTRRCVYGKSRQEKNKKWVDGKDMCLIRRETGRRPGSWISNYLDPQGAPEKEHLVRFTSGALWNINRYVVAAGSWVFFFCKKVEFFANNHESAKI